MTMKKAEEILKPYNFMRIHRCSIANISRMKYFDTESIVFEGGLTAVWSDPCRKEFLKKYENILF
jgi:DNA-binding LytR/AlgR family response regulator